jgi:hypothetical protein
MLGAESASTVIAVGDLILPEDEDMTTPELGTPDDSVTHSEVDEGRMVVGIGEAGFAEGPRQHLNAAFPE